MLLSLVRRAAPPAAFAQHVPACALASADVLLLWTPPKDALALTLILYTIHTTYSASRFKDRFSHDVRGGVRITTTVLLLAPSIQYSVLRCKSTRHVL